MAVTQGTWGNLLGPLSNVDVGATEWLTRIGVLPYSPLTYNPAQSITSPGLDYSKMPEVIRSSPFGQVSGISGGMSTQPTTQPTGGTGGTTQPQQQQQPSNAPPYSGTFEGQGVNYGNGQWRWGNGRWNWEGSNEERTAAEQRAQQDILSEINKIYEPLYGIYTQQEEALKARQPEQERLIGERIALGIEGVRGQEKETQAQIGERQEDVEAAKQDAYAQARRLYNDLLQQYQATLGGRSGAAQYAVSRLGEATTQRFGEIEKTRQKAIRDIVNEKSRLQTWVNQSIKDWDVRKDEAIQALKSQFEQQLGQINASRGMLESQKAQSRAQALQDFQTRQAALKQADEQFQQQLALFQAQKNTQFSQAENQTYNLGITSAGLTSPFAQTNIQMPGVSFAQPQAQAAFAGGGAPQYSPAGGEGTRDGNYVFTGGRWVYSPQ